MELMARYEDNYFDYAITDPPYNLNFKYNKYKDDLSEKQYKDWCYKWFSELERICKKGIFISCGINNLGLWHEIKKPKWVLCWHKPAAMGRSPTMALKRFQMNPGQDLNRKRSRLAGVSTPQPDFVTSDSM